MSDTQLVSGIAMLISASKKLRDGSISVYHFNIVTDLAWFSSNTHILTLLVIRSFSQSVKPQSRTEVHSQLLELPAERVHR